MLNRPSHKYPLAIAVAITALGGASAFVLVKNEVKQTGMKERTSLRRKEGTLSGAGKGGSGGSAGSDYQSQLQSHPSITRLPDSKVERDPSYRGEKVQFEEPSLRNIEELPAPGMIYPRPDDPDGLGKQSMPQQEAGQGQPKPPQLQDDEDDEDAEEILPPLEDSRPIPASRAGELPKQGATFVKGQPSPEDGFSRDFSTFKAQPLSEPEKQGLGHVKITDMGEEKQELPRQKLLDATFTQAKIKQESRTLTRKVDEKSPILDGAKAVFDELAKLLALPTLFKPKEDVEVKLTPNALKVEKREEKTEEMHPLPPHENAFEKASLPEFRATSVHEKDTQLLGQVKTPEPKFEEKQELPRQKLLDATFTQAKIKQESKTLTRKVDEKGTILDGAKAAFDALAKLLALPHLFKPKEDIEVKLTPNALKAEKREEKTEEMHPLPPREDAFEKASLPEFRATSVHEKDTQLLGQVKTLEPKFEQKQELSRQKLLDATFTQTKIQQESRTLHGRGRVNDGAHYLWDSAKIVADSLSDFLSSMYKSSDSELTSVPKMGVKAPEAPMEEVEAQKTLKPMEPNFLVGAPKVGVKTLDASLEKAQAEVLKEPSQETITSSTAGFFPKGKEKSPDVKVERLEKGQIAGEKARPEAPKPLTQEAVQGLKLDQPMERKALLDKSAKSLNVHQNLLNMKMESKTLSSKAPEGAPSLWEKAKDILDNLATMWTQPRDLEWKVEPSLESAKKVSPTPPESLSASAELDIDALLKEKEMMAPKIPMRALDQKINEIFEEFKGFDDFILLEQLAREERLEEQLAKEDIEAIHESLKQVQSSQTREQKVTEKLTALKELEGQHDALYKAKQELALAKKKLAKKKLGKTDAKTLQDQANQIEQGLKTVGKKIQSLRAELIAEDPLLQNSLKEFEEKNNIRVVEQNLEDLARLDALDSYTVRLVHQESLDLKPGEVGLFKDKGKLYVKVLDKDVIELPEPGDLENHRIYDELKNMLQDFAKIGPLLQQHKDQEAKVAELEKAVTKLSFQKGKGDKAAADGADIALKAAEKAQEREKRAAAGALQQRGLQDDKQQEASKQLKAAKDKLKAIEGQLNAVWDIASIADATAETVLQWAADLGYTPSLDELKAERQAKVNKALGIGKTDRELGSVVEKTGPVVPKDALVAIPKEAPLPAKGKGITSKPTSVTKTPPIGSEMLSAAALAGAELIAKDALVPPAAEAKAALDLSGVDIAILKKIINDEDSSILQGDEDDDFIVELASQVSDLEAQLAKHGIALKVPAVSVPVDIAMVDEDVLKAAMNRFDPAAYPMDDLSGWLFEMAKQDFRTGLKPVDELAKHYADIVAERAQPASAAVPAAGKLPEEEISKDLVSEFMTALGAYYEQTQHRGGGKKRALEIQAKLTEEEIKLWAIVDTVKQAKVSQELAKKYTNLSLVQRLIQEELGSDDLTAFSTKDLLESAIGILQDKTQASKDRQDALHAHQRQHILTKGGGTVGDIDEDAVPTEADAFHMHSKMELEKFRKNATSDQKTRLEEYEKRILADPANTPVVTQVLNDVHKEFGEAVAQGLLVDVKTKNADKPETDQLEGYIIRTPDNKTFFVYDRAENMNSLLGEETDAKGVRMLPLSAQAIAVLENEGMKHGDKVRVTAKMSKLLGDEVISLEKSTREGMRTSPAALPKAPKNKAPILSPEEIAAMNAIGMPLSASVGTAVPIETVEQLQDKLAAVKALHSNWARVMQNDQFGTLENWLVQRGIVFNTKPSQNELLEKGKQQLAEFDKEWDTLEAKIAQNLSSATVIKDDEGTAKQKVDATKGSNPNEVMPKRTSSKAKLPLAPSGKKHDDTL